MFKNTNFFHSQKKYKSKAIGIDLGTTYSSVAIFQNQKVHIIPNDQGKKITSSYVAFTQNQRLIGDSAFNQTSKNPNNTIFQFKRLLGRKFSDPIVQEDIKRWPFKVESDIQDKPVFVVKFKKQIKKFYPQQIQSMILSKLKSIAQKYIGESIQNAVITVPANFTDGQRQATKDAGKIAGINVIRILSQPVAAAIAYGLDKKSQEAQNVLIFDFGGGTLDVSILVIDKGVFEVKSTSGDTHLGGIDFDNKIVQYCIESFYKRKGVDIRNNPRAIRRLKTQCEKAKRILSSSFQVTIQVDTLAESEDFSLNLNRTKFEELCKQQFQKIMKPVQRVIKDSGLNISQINEVVLVGGSTRIPKIRQILKKYLGGKEPNMSVNLDQAVAYGAAIHAAMLNNQYNGNTQCLIIDTAPFSIGIQTQGGVMTPIVVRNTSIPTEKSLTVTTSYDNQSTISIIIFQGEDKLVKNNKKLGHFNINGIQSGPKGVHPIQISLHINEDGIMTLGISKQNLFKKLKIQNKKGRLSNAQINMAILESERLKRQDQNMLEVTELKNQLESYCFSMKQKINQIQNWMRQNKCTNPDQYKQKFNEINQFGKCLKKRKI